MPPSPHDDLGHEKDPRNVMRELEAAWERWLRGNPSDDARIVSLLRAAFAAGYEAGHGNASRDG